MSRYAFFSGIFCVFRKAFTMALRGAGKLALDIAIQSVAEARGHIPINALIST